MDPIIEPMGESALLVRLGTRIDVSTNQRVHALCRHLRQARWAVVQDLVPAYASVLVRLDPAALESGALSLEAATEQLRGLIQSVPAAPDAAAGTLHRIPVCYGGEHGPDMLHVEHATGLSADRVIALHAGGEYRVAMIGFAPGFPYLLGLDERLHVPRRDQPRTRVPRGAVAIGGAQTGVYPGELPGGWQLIGRTPLRLFDAGQGQRPSLLAPGDRVRFEVISTERFRDLDEGPDQ
jgi:KipI family sensor histidine kinase inhibitor